MPLFSVDYVGQNAEPNKHDDHGQHGDCGTYEEKR